MRKIISTLVLAAATLTATSATPAQADTTAWNAADGHVYVWEHVGAGGVSCKWAGDDSNYRFNVGCGNMNDIVSSASNKGYAGAYEDVVFYEHIERGGASVCLPNGVYWSSMPAGWNDRISSHSWGSGC